MMSLPTAAPAALVYETTVEFLTSGDFNGDGIPDVLVLDKATGNARVGYQDSSGGLTWSSPLVTDVPGAAGCAVGRLLSTSTDAVAVTAPDLNRIHLVSLSVTNTAPPPTVVSPAGLGPHTLVALPNPAGGAPPAYNSMLVASSDNNASAEKLDLLSLNAGVATAAGQFTETGPFDRGNALALSVTPATFAVGLVRGATNDTLDAWQFTNAPGVLATLSNLPPGSDYTFGTFNGETLPRFLFYVPGQSNITIVPLVATSGGYAFSSVISLSLTQALQGVFYVTQGANGSAILLFSDGVEGLTLPAGTPALSAKYTAGLGATGNVFTGVVPLGTSFALLDAPASGAIASHAQVLQFNGASFTQRSSASLPTLTTRSTRANVWLFQTEPFITSNPNFVASSNAPDWSVGASLPGGVLTVLAETDNGSASGLGSPVTNNLGIAPAGANFAIPEQYQDFISLFSYSAPRPAEPINITISPTPGLYGGAIQVSFATLNSSDRVFYRAGASGSYQPFAAPFALTNDTTVQYYGTNSTSASRSQLYTAAYSFGRAGAAPPTAPLDLAPGSTNPAPVLQTNQVILSDAGTVFYGRRSSNNVATVWAINLDGSGETYITQGARPRASRDGQWLAFLREGDPFNNQGNLWVRNVASGQETRLLLANTNQIPDTNYLVCYDWDLTDTNLIFDFNDHFWRIGLDGSTAPFPLGANYNQGAPAVNPVDGRVAFHILYPGPSGIYLAPADLSSAQPLFGYPPTGPLWPAWSPDGRYLSLADSYVGPQVDGGRNLWVAELGSSNTSVFQITGFTDSTNGFPHGAQWSPAGDALVGAGTVFGTNGIWVIPLNPDCMCSDAPLVLPPTSPGDPIDFVGSIVAAPAPLTVVEPALFILVQSGAAVVYWSAAYQGFALETATDLKAPTTWTPIPSPYAFDGTFYQYSEPLASLAAKKFFRLHYTGVTQ